MPITITKGALKYKAVGSDSYQSLDLIANNSLEESLAAMDAKEANVLNNIPEDYSQLSVNQRIDEYFTNSGQYTIQENDLESGNWIYSEKQENAGFGRTKFLIPVREGMVIEYGNVSGTFDTYFGILETTSSNTYIQILDWKNTTENYDITKNGFLVIRIRNHGDSSIPINIENYDCTITILTKTASTIDQIEDPIVALPQSGGPYMLTVTIVNGNPVYNWVPVTSVSGTTLVQS